ncbi:hypothetical protein [Maritimibacter sp. DP1N21-5]|uniref:hypothetical protein n=1 Tax=Maritimibacter sp. DP1N21-5 TaxID=2836867 RepID=UPI001C482E47|nr:hypothetical protein [Maritimibacter sp. DP1N21-5]MBV7408724.1 hypothetical protein [Maritimibacter sp. DP1N21-5]
MKKELPQPRGDRSKLTPEERDRLENEIIPNARAWLADKHNPPLSSKWESAVRTLRYWGEEI